MVVAVNTGVMKVGPILTRLPAAGASYHSILPLAAVAVNVAFDPEQIFVPDAVGGAGTGFIVTVTALRALVQLLTVV